MINVSVDVVDWMFQMEYCNLKNWTAVLYRRVDNSLGKVAEVTKRRRLRRHYDVHNVTSIERVTPNISHDGELRSRVRKREADGHTSRSSTSNKRQAVLHAALHMLRGAYGMSDEMLHHCNCSNTNILRRYIRTRLKSSPSQ